MDHHDLPNGRYTEIHAGEGPEAGLMGRRPFDGGVSHWLPYIRVAELGRRHKARGRARSHPARRPQRGPEHRLVHLARGSDRRALRALGEEVTESAPSLGAL
jgi:hypothetical protein